MGYDATGDDGDERAGGNAAPVARFPARRGGICDRGVPVYLLLPDEHLCQGWPACAFAGVATSVASVCDLSRREDGTVLVRAVVRLPLLRIVIVATTRVSRQSDSELRFRHNHPIVPRRINELHGLNLWPTKCIRDAHEHVPTSPGNSPGR